jgi:TnpA family transposase
LDVWDKKGLGRMWGKGTSVAADGRSIVASECSLQSAYHYRHRRTGVTLYWLVRDDWIGSRVGVIGNHEWESWFLLDGLLAPFGGHVAEWAAGDTHGQHLALWGLSFLVDKEVRARFHGLSNVKLYHDGPVSDLPVRGVLRIRWHIVEQAAQSLARLVASIKSGKISARDILRASNFYDEGGINIAEALRELGKAVRTAYVLRYALSEDLRREVREACNHAETWNSFQEAVFWGHGGRMRTSDPRRKDVNALCMQLLMNSIVFYNAEKYGDKLCKIKGSSPVTWEHVRLLGDYRITLSRGQVEKVHKKLEKSQ